MTDTKTNEAGTPLTVEILADALSCFWNAALGAACNQQVGYEVATIMVEVEGADAVANRLSEYSKERITRADLLADMTRQRDEFTAALILAKEALAALIAHTYDCGVYLNKAFRVESVPLTDARAALDAINTLAEGAKP